MDGLRWPEGYEAWKRLRRWHERSTADGDAALDALSDIGVLRRLLDQAELAAVRAARGRAKSWAEIATRLGVTRQSAWERWRDLDETPTRAAAEEAAAAELVTAALGSPTTLVVVPDVVGLEWETARRVLISAGLVAVSADPDGPPLSSTDGRFVIDQKPAAGERVDPGSSVQLWLGRGPGSAGVREPLHPRPTPRATGGAIDEATGKAIP
jgi:hypothetical protein